MKRLLTILFVLIGAAGWAQTKLPTYFNAYHINYPRITARSVLHVPQINIADTSNRDITITKDTAEIAIIGNDFWWKPTNGRWFKAGTSSGGGGNGLQEVIAGYGLVNVNDSTLRLDSSKAILNQSAYVQDASVNINYVQTKSLHVIQDTGSGSDADILIQSFNPDADGTVSIQKADTNINRAWVRFGNIGSTAHWGFGILKGDNGLSAPLRLGWKNGSRINAEESQFTFTPAGRLGVGVLVPGYALDVKGYINTDSGAYVPMLSLADSSMAVPPTKWVKQLIAGLGGGSVDLSGYATVSSLNAYLLKSDTAAMLSPYLRKIDTTGKWQPAGNYASATHTHTAANITDFQSSVSSNTDVAANTTARHTHSNKTLLDTYDQTNANIADAVTKKHAHANLSALDNVSGVNTGDETTTRINALYGYTPANAATVATNTADIATNTSAIALKAPLASPTFTGTVTTGVISPAANVTYDIGSSSNRYLNIFATNHRSGGMLGLYSGSAASQIVFQLGISLEVARFAATTGNLLLNTSTDVTSAIFNAVSTTKGVLIPRMTKAQRDAISSPSQGLLVFVTDNGGYLSWYNSGWQKVSSTAD